MKRSQLNILFVILLLVLSTSLICYAEDDRSIIVNNGESALTIIDNCGLTSEVVPNGRFNKINDSVLYIHGNSTADSSYDTSGKNYVNLNLASKIGSKKDYKKVTVVFDFMLTENDTSIGFRGRQAAGGMKTYFNLKAGNDVQAHTWNRVALVLGADGFDNTYKIYLNGVIYKSGVTSEGSYGFAESGNILFMVNKNKDFGVYIDNLLVSAGDNGYTGQTAPTISSSLNSIKIEGNNVIYNKSIKTTGNLNNIITMNDSNAELFFLDRNFLILDSSQPISELYKIVAVSESGIYNYYNVNEEIITNTNKTITFMLNNMEKRAYIKTNNNIYYMPTAKADMDILFDCNSISEASINSTDIYILEDNKTKIFLTAIKTGENKLSISASDLEPFTEYVVYMNNIQIDNFIAEDICFSFVTGDGGINKSVPMQQLINNEVSTNGWQKYGGLSSINAAYDNSLDCNVITTSGRSQYFHGITHTIPYETLSKKTGDFIGDTSVYHLSYKIKLNKDTDTCEGLNVIMKWIADGKDVNENDYNTVSIYRYSLESLTRNDWKEVNTNIVLHIPEQIRNANEAYLKIIIIGEKGQTECSDFSITDFSMYKWSICKTINLTVDDTKKINTINNSVLGYSIEGCYWISDSDQNVVYDKTNKFRPAFLDVVSSYNFKKIRIGGYSSNYEFWKANLGDISNRIPTYEPAPKSYWKNPDVEEYWRENVEYIGTFERLNLAETFGLDNEIIMCANIWSALPTTIDYTQEYTKPVYPNLVINSATGEIDYNVLKQVCKDLKDLIRFTTLSPDDEKATDTFGTNWAQKRVDLGHTNPYNIDVWELGNELYLRGISGHTYVDMCNYIIADIKKEFPGIKFAVHVKENYGDWLEYVIHSLADKVDYISTHNYYSYYSEKNSVIALESIEDAIKSSSNPNLKYLVTEGGLSNHHNTYIGPSCTSVAMCSSFADYMNRVSKLEGLDSFQYFGSAKQLCYDTSFGGWNGYGQTVVITDNITGDGIDISGRKSWVDGITQNIPIAEFIKGGHLPGTTKTYNISYDIKFSGNPDEQIELKFEWYNNDVFESTAYSQVFGGYTENEWINVQISKEITVPEIYNMDSAYLRIYISSAKNIRSTQYADFSIKDLTFAASGSDSLTENHKKDSDLFGSSYENTAFGNLVKKYIEELNGDIIYTENDNKSTDGLVSELAVKSDNGVCLFVSNLSETDDYSIKLKSDKRYLIKNKFIVSADSLYSEKNAYYNDIYEVNENTNELFDSIVIPKHSAAVIKLVEAGITDSVTFGSDSVNLVGTNTDNESSLIIAFYNSENTLVHCEIKELKDVTDFNYSVKLPEDYSKMILCKWNLDNFTPLAVNETYINNKTN